MSQPPARDARLRWVALGYAALAVLFTWPLALGLGRDVPGDLGDSLLNMWILAWGADHAPRLVTGVMSWTAFWNGNIFHPEPYSLALSEHLFPQALQIAPIYALTGNIILCYNLLFLSTFVLSALGTYLLVRDLTGDWRAAVVAGLVYGFLPYRIAQVPHLQILSSQWMPFVLWGLHRFAAHGSTRALVGGTVALVLQNWSCGYYLLYFAPFVPVFAVQQLWMAGRLKEARAWRGLALAATATVVLTLPFLLPYLEVQRLYAFERPFGEVVSFSANVWSYATAAESIHLWGRLIRLHPAAEGETFLGVTAPVLAVVAISVAAIDAGRDAARVPRLAGWRRWLAVGLTVVFVVQAIGLLSSVIVGGLRVQLAGVSVRASIPARLLAEAVAAIGGVLVLSPRARHVARELGGRPAVFFFALAVCAMWLSLGPEPSAGPSRVPGIGLYRVLYDFVPGFTGLRVPARYAMIAGLFLAVTAGYGVARLARRPWGTAAVALAGLLVVADSAAMPLMHNYAWGGSELVPPARVYPASGAPAVYRRVRALPEGVVLAEFPFGDPAWEMRYVYYAAAHRRPIVNGYSGAFPRGYQRRVAALQRFQGDGDTAWTALRDAAVTHVVVHTTAFANPDDPRALVAWLTDRGARLVETLPDGDALYELPRP